MSEEWLLPRKQPVSFPPRQQIPHFARLDSHSVEIPGLWEVETSVMD